MKRFGIWHRPSGRWYLDKQGKAYSATNQGVAELHLEFLVDDGALRAVFPDHDCEVAELPEDEKKKTRLTPPEPAK